MIGELSFFGILVALLYLPIYSFSYGVSYNGHGRIYRTPSKIEPLVLAPFSFLYIIISIQIVGIFLKKILSPLNFFDLQDAYLTLIYPVQLVLSKLNISNTLLDFIFVGFPSYSIRPEINFSFVITFSFYMLFTLVIPFKLGVYASELSFDKDRVYQNYLGLRNHYLVTKYSTRKISKFFFFYYLFCCAGKEYYLLVKFILGLPPFLLFNFLRKKNVLEILIKLCSNQIVPNDFKPVFDPNRTIVADITLSDKKMVTGVLADIELERDKTFLYKLESPIRWERKPIITEYHGDDKSTFEYSWNSVVKKIPGLFLFIPASQVMDINIYNVPHELFITTNKVINKKNIDEYVKKIVEKLRPYTNKNKYVFSHIFIMYVGDNTIVNEFNRKLRIHYDFAKIGFLPSEDEELQSFVKEIMDFRNNILNLEQ